MRPGTRLRRWVGICGLVVGTDVPPNDNGRRIVPAGRPKFNVSRSAVLARRVAAGNLDLAPEVFEGHLELPILEVLLRLLRRDVLPRDHAPVVDPVEQLVLLRPVELQGVTLVGPHPPVLLLLAGGARLVQVPAARRPEGGRGQLDLPAGEREFLDVLDASLAEAALAHDDGPAVVLQACGQDLTPGRGPVVYQANHREVEVAALVAALDRPLLRPAIARAD